jgi:hypothetical protein
VATAADGVAQPAEDHEYQTDDENDDADGPQDGDVGQESDEQKDDAENDHDEFLLSKGERKRSQSGGAVNAPANRNVACGETTSLSCAYHAN